MWDCALTWIVARILACWAGCKKEGLRLSSGPGDFFQSAIFTWESCRDRPRSSSLCFSQTDPSKHKNGYNQQWPMTIMGWIIILINLCLLIVDEPGQGCWGICWLKKYVGRWKKLFIITNLHLVASDRLSFLKLPLRCSWAPDCPHKHSLGLDQRSRGVEMAELGF